MSENRPATTDHQLSRKKPNLKKVQIALDSEVADRYEDAKSAFDVAESMMKYKPDDTNTQLEFEQAKEALSLARLDMEVNSLEFVFKSIGRKGYEDLLMEHRPTPEQQKRAKAEGGGEYSFNPDTFPPALTFAAMSEPAMTEEEFMAQIWNNDDWNENEAVSLFTAAMEANSSRRIIDFPKGSRRT